MNEATVHQNQGANPAEGNPAPAATASGETRVPAPIRDLQTSLKQLDRRDWWLWATAAIILLLLCAAVFSLSFPAAWGGPTNFVPRPG
jgi:hypothetical protein